MNPTTRKLMVWAGVFIQASFLFMAFQVIRLFTPGIAAIVQRAQLTMLPHPTRILLGHTSVIATIPLVLIGVLGAAVAWIQLRVREEANQLAGALLVQAVFWWLLVSYVGAVSMAAMLPFFHLANR
jgi:hypothetical protein